MTDLFIRRAVSVGTLGASLLLFGCGGGGGDSGGGSPPAVTSVDVPITVVDGLIQNANVCLDKNNNGTCESKRMEYGINIHKNKKGIFRCLLQSTITTPRINP